MSHRPRSATSKMSDRHVDSHGTTLALFQQELADPKENLAIQDFLFGRPFHQFSKFPLELRLKIYRYMFPKARCFVIYKEKKETRRDVFLFKAPLAPVTSLLSTESRKETLQAYKIMKAPRTGNRKQVLHILWDSLQDLVQCTIDTPLSDLMPRLFYGDGCPLEAFVGSNGSFQLVFYKPVSKSRRILDLFNALTWLDIFEYLGSKEVVLRKGSGNRVVMEAWRHHFVKQCNAWKDFRAEAGLEFERNIPTVRILGESSDATVAANVSRGMS